MRQRMRVSGVAARFAGTSLAAQTRSSGDYRPAPPARASIHSRIAWMLAGRTGYEAITLMATTDTQLSTG